MLQKSILQEELDSFNLPIGPWQITTPPPAITSSGNYQKSPTDPVNIQLIKGVKFQRITFDEPTSENMSINPSQKGYPTKDAWRIIKPNNKAGSALGVNLNLDQPISIFITVAWKPGPAMPEPGTGVKDNFSITVNGKEIPPMSKRAGSYTCKIPANYFKADNNEILIQGNMLIASISAMSYFKSLQAKSYWKVVAQETLGQGAEYSRAHTVETGVLSSVSETKAFAASVGIKVSAKEDAIFAELTEELSVGFTFTKTLQSQVTHSMKEATTTTHTIKTVAGMKSATFQIWMLCFEYVVEGSNLQAALDVNVNPIQVNVYQEPLT